MRGAATCWREGERSDEDPDWWAATAQLGALSSPGRAAKSSCHRTEVAPSASHRGRQSQRQPPTCNPEPCEGSRRWFTPLRALFLSSPQPHSPTSGTTRVVCRSQGAVSTAITVPDRPPPLGMLWVASGLRQAPPAQQNGRRKRHCLVTNLSRFGRQPGAERLCVVCGELCARVQKVRSRASRPVPEIDRPVVSCGENESIWIPTLRCGRGP